MSLGQLTADYADSDDEQVDQLEMHSGKSDDTKKRKSLSPSPKLDDKQALKRRKSNEEKTKSSKKVPTEDYELDDKLRVIVDEDEEDEKNWRKSREVSPVLQRPVDRLRQKESGSRRTSPASLTGSSKNTPNKKLSRLVSYAAEDDAEELSESEEEEVLHSEPMDTGTDGEDDTSSSHADPSRGPSSPHTSSNAPQSKDGVVVIDGITLPMAPQGKKCSQVLQDKIAKALADIKRGHKDYNVYQNTKDFRNPSIYEKLVDHLRLDENGTNYPIELYDPHCWGKESFYDELAKVQKEEMERREKDKKDKAKADIVSGQKKSSEEEVRKRKSRFDSGRPDGSAAAVAKPVGIVSSLPAHVGAKTTIDAFGSLNKKLKT